MRLLFMLISIFAISIEARAQGCSFPVPDYQIEVTSFTGLGRASYDRVNATIKRVYGPIFAQAGCPLEVHDEWSDGTVNAQAWQSGGKCHIAIFGGLARHALATENAVLQVGMHEIGHHLGGAPFYSGDNMSCEGQADYFSTADGMPRAGKGSVNSSMALASLLASLNGEPKPRRPSPALKNVSRTYCSHPRGQCRLNTYDAGRVGARRPGCWYK